METVQWVFGGVGVAVPLAIIGWLLSKRERPTQSQRGGRGSINIQAGQDLDIGRASRSSDEDA